MSDYHIHLGSRDFASLFNDEEADAEREPRPFYEDPDELDQIIAEEIGRPNPYRRKKGTSSIHKRRSR